MTNTDEVYEYLLGLTNEELEVEARRAIQYYNAILIVIGGNIAEQAYLEDIPAEGDKDE